jgi:hypothetical protein
VPDAPHPLGHSASPRVEAVEVPNPTPGRELFLVPGTTGPVPRDQHVHEDAPIRDQPPDDPTQQPPLVLVASDPEPIEVGDDVEPAPGFGLVEIARDRTERSSRHHGSKLLGVRRQLSLDLDGHNIVARDRKSGGGRARARPKLEDPEGLRPGVPGHRIDTRVPIIRVEVAPSTSPVGPLVLLGIEVPHPVHAGHPL